MSDHYAGQPMDLFETEAARSLLDQLLVDSKLYSQSKDYKELLEFIVRLRNFAPFNAMLLQLQKPGLAYAASAPDWRERFERFPKERARPLLILWPFGPVALVYDVMDTVGKELPTDVSNFFARGPISQSQIASFAPMMLKKHIEWVYVDAGDKQAGSIRFLRRASDDKDHTFYRIHINRNYDAPAQFATLSHELAHLFLGHLGPDKKLNVPSRAMRDYARQELEAESVAFLVCERNGVKPKSESYLAGFVSAATTTCDLDLYQIMRAAGQVETILGLTARTKYDRPSS